MRVECVFDGGFVISAKGIPFASSLVRRIGFSRSHPDLASLVI